MRLVRYFVAVALLVCSGQSLALFMPGGVQINIEVPVVTNEGGC